MNNYIKPEKITAFSLIFNISYAVFHSVVGLITHSWWLTTIGAYYIVLSVARFSVLAVNKNPNNSPENSGFIKQFTGFLFVLLSVCLIGIIILSAVKERGNQINEIIMITIATYTFSKVVTAIANLVKSAKQSLVYLKILRNISLADALVSVYSLQRSMLVSFPGMEPQSIILFNILTGSAVFLSILLLGINMIGGRYTDMAKSKIAKANKKIADSVVGGYKKIEKSVVDGYTKIEDKFVDAYLTKDGETVEEAKKRLKNK